MKEPKLRMKEEPTMKEITPLRDFVIVQNDYRIVLRKGEPESVPLQFLENLKTEKVI